MSRTVRAIVAAVAMFVAGWTVARALMIILGAIAVPSFTRILLPTRFDYSTPPGWNESTWWMWVLGAIAFVSVPLCMNATWMSRRIVSAAGLVKLVVAALLVALVAFVSLTGGDLFTAGPWGGGAGRSLLEHLGMIVLAGTCGGALLSLFGDGTPAGAPDAWRVTATPGAARRGFISGFLVSAIVALLAWFAAGENGLGLLLRAVTSFLGESAEVSPVGWTRLQWGLTIAIGLPLATYGALLVAAAPDGEQKQGRAASIVTAAVPAAALIALVLWFRGYVNTVGDMNHTLTQAAGLDPVPPVRLMILPAANGARMYAYPMRVALPGWTDDSVAATSHNVALARAYVARLNGRWNAHTLQAWELPGSVYDRLLQPDSALHARIEAAEATGSVLASAVAMSGVRRMPTSDAVRAATARLLDTAHFRGSDSATIRLQGDIRAPHDRAVTGTVTLPASMRAGGGARVALYRHSGSEAPTSVPTAISLVAATSLDATGRFAFDSLPASTYMVGVLLPDAAGSDPARVTVTGSLRVMDLSLTRRGDAGSIVVTLR